MALSKSNDHVEQSQAIRVATACLESLLRIELIHVYAKSLPVHERPEDKRLLESEVHVSADRRLWREGKLRSQHCPMTLDGRGRVESVHNVCCAMNCFT